MTRTEVDLYTYASRQKLDRHLRGVGTLVKDGKGELLICLVELVSSVAWRVSTEVGVEFAYVRTSASSLFTASGDSECARMWFEQNLLLYASAVTVHSAVPHAGPSKDRQTRKSKILEHCSSHVSVTHSVCDSDHRIAGKCKRPDRRHGASGQHGSATVSVASLDTPFLSTHCFVLTTMSSGTVVPKASLYYYNKSIWASVRKSRPFLRGQWHGAKSRHSSPRSVGDSCR